MEKMTVKHKISKKRREANKPTICVDFDGVLNRYDGWKGHHDLSYPRPGAREFLIELSKKYTVVIFTVRYKPVVMDWLNYYKMPYDDVTDIKVPAVAYIDDRAIQFKGSYVSCLEELEDFEPHWKKRDIWAVDPVTEEHS